VKAYAVVFNLNRNTLTHLSPPKRIRSGCDPKYQSSAKSRSFSTQQYSKTCPTDDRMPLGTKLSRHASPQMRIPSLWGFQKTTTQLSGREAKASREDRNSDYASLGPCSLSHESWHWVSTELRLCAMEWESRAALFTTTHIHLFYFCPEQQDESSSALDAQAEQDLLLSLRRLLESDDNNLSAVLFITHKKTVMNACDRSIMLSEGRVTSD